MPKYDYSSIGLYYVTLCVDDRQHILGKVIDSQIHLSSIGQMIEKAWRGIIQYDPRISLDEFIVMPNHFHGIVGIGVDGFNPNGGRGQCPAPTISLSSIIRRFKSWTANQYRKMGPDYSYLWQRGYYEHIIRDDNDLNRIRQYIRDNPKNWPLDPENQKPSVVS